MRTIQLTEDQWNQIKRDAEGVKLLTNEEVEKIAEKLQKSRNLPFLSEEKEFVVFVKIVRKLDKVLYENLPNEIYTSVRDLEGGLTENELKRLIRSLTKFINDKVDISYLPEIAEKFLIKGFLHIVVGALAKGKSLAKNLEHDIPE